MSAEWVQRAGGCVNTCGVWNMSVYVRVGLFGRDYGVCVFGAPKSLQMVTAAMKLKDAYSLEEKL